MAYGAGGKRWFVLVNIGFAGEYVGLRGACL